jgi:uncharacterized protein (TIGR03437 family)
MLSPIPAFARWMLLLASIQLLPAATGNQILLRSLDAADGIPELLSADTRSHLFVTSDIPSTAYSSTSRIVELDLNGGRIASMDLPQMRLLSASIADATGDLIVVGSDQNSNGIVLKLDPQLRSVLLSKSLPATINAVTVDVSGKIYLTGVTKSPNFPITPDAYQTKPPSPGFMGSPAYAFLTELSPAGDVLYSTYFGADGAVCRGGGFCVGKFAETKGIAIALDKSGAIVIAGNTTASNLATTPGALATTCTCGYDFAFGGGAYSGFIARFQPGAPQQLLSATYLNSSFTPASVTVNAIALDSAGNVIVGGSAAQGLPTTAGALQPMAPYSYYDSVGFLVKLDSGGTTALWGTYFGQLNTSVSNLFVDSQGRVVFNGYMPEMSDPSLSLYPSYVGRLASDGSSLVDFYKGPASNLFAGPGLVLTSTGGFAAVTHAGSLWIETPTVGPSLLNIADSASGLSSNTVVARELITLYGLGIGPPTPMTGQIENGAFTSSLAGYEVLFDGKPAPLTYADSGQINAVVPRAVASSTHLQIVTPSGMIDGPVLSAGIRPAIFRNSDTGLAAALNQDGSVNSGSNRAKPGTTVAVWVTGAGAGDVSFPDGAVVPLQIIHWIGPVVALAGNRSLEVSFAGYAPETVAGVVQVNFRIPDSVSPGMFAFSLGFNGAFSQYAYILVTP